MKRLSFVMLILCGLAIPALLTAGLLKTYQTQCLRHQWLDRSNGC